MNTLLRPLRLLYLRARLRWAMQDARACADSIDLARRELEEFPLRLRHLQKHVAAIEVEICIAQAGRRSSFSFNRETT